MSLFFKNLFNFYYDGFKNMATWGRRAWIVIIIKLFIIFFILRLFFFQDFLNKRYSNDSQKSEYVLDQLIKAH